MLNPGDMQSMNFLTGDDGPFWMTAEEHKRKHHDKDTGKMWKQQYMTKELTATPQQQGNIITGRKK